LSALRERCQQIRERLSFARDDSLASAVLARADTGEARKIWILANLLARQGGFDARGTSLLPDGNLKRSLIAALHCWAEVLIASGESKRCQLADLGEALSRLGAPESIPILSRLLDEDLARRLRAIEAVKAAQQRGIVVDRSEAQTLYNWQYRQSFINFGGRTAAMAAIPYLDDPSFGFDAANVVKSLYDLRQGEREKGRTGGGIDYSKVPQRGEPVSRLASGSRPSQKPRQSSPPLTV
jgi:hypothetical protein